MEFSYEGIALIPIITVMVNLIKRIGLPNDLAPFVSIAIGIVFGIMFLSNGNIKMGILAGIIMGTSASGLYSSGKKVVRGVQHKGR